MRRFLLALLALVPPSLGVPSASAAGSSGHVGDCEYTLGALYVASAVYSLDPVENPVTARVTCSLWYDGTRLAWFPATGTAFVHALAQTPQWIGDLVVCTDVEYLSTGDPSDHACVADVESPVALTVDDALIELGETLGGVPDQVDTLLQDVTSIPDPVVCPLLAARAPGIPAVVDISPQGDVYVAGENVWDCPPYGAVPSLGDTSSHAGTCEYVPGNLYSAITVFSTDRDENLIIARVTCTLWRAGQVIESTSIVGQGLLAGRKPTANHLGDLIVCTDIEYLSTGDPSDHVCVVDQESQAYDIAGNVLDEVT